MVKNKAFKVLTISAATVIALSGCAASGMSADQKAPAQNTQQSPAEKKDEAKITVENTWVKSAKKGKSTSAFAEIKNKGSKSAKLIGAEVSQAKTVQLHDTGNDDGSKKMYELKDGIEVKPGDSVSLKPGGKHIMLMGLTEDLKAGNTVVITLKFDNGLSVKHTFDIRDFSGDDDDYDDDHDDDHDDKHDDHHDHDDHDDDDHDH